MPDKFGVITRDLWNNKSCKWRKDACGVVTTEVSICRRFGPAARGRVGPARRSRLDGGLPAHPPLGTLHLALLGAG